MIKRTARGTLELIITTLMECLEELYKTDCRCNDFIYGEKTAYIECLELIQHWEDAEKNGLNFNIEARFPL